MSASESDPAAPVALSPLARGVLTFATMLAVVIQGVDGTIANVALPYMQGAMSASQEQINWVLTSYIVASAIMTSPTGYLASRFGRRRFFVFAVVGFTASSVLCGMAQSLEQIVLFRILQGMCGAALIPLSQVVLLDINPPENRGAAMGLWTMGVMLGPILGPTLGGILTDHYSWRSVFYVNLPLGAVTAMGLLLFLPETPRRRDLSLDWLGFGALSLGIGMLQAVLDRGETLDWFSSKEIVTESLLSGLGFYMFFVQFFFAQKPFLTPRLFADTNFVVGSILVFLVGGSLYSTLALLSPYVQDLMNYPVLTAGFVLAPRGLGSMLSAFISGRLIGRVGARSMVLVGGVISAAVQYSMSFWTPDVSAATIATTGFIQGIGVTLITVPISTFTFSTLAADLRAEAAGVFSLLRTMGSAVGISVTGALVEIYTQVNHATIAGMVTPFNRLLASGAAAQYWNPESPAGAMALNGEITRQGTIIAYGDDFKLMCVLMVLTLPLALLIRAPGRRIAVVTKEAAAE